VHFREVETVLRECLVALMAEKGHTIEKDVTLATLIQPSIFDDDKSRELKGSLTDVQEYITECN